MQPIKKDELFRNLGDFVKSKGIELKEGSYSARIKQCCDVLTDAVNATQETVQKTKSKVDQALDQLRQTIHAKTAPQPPPRPKRKRSEKAHSRAKPQSRRGR